MTIVELLELAEGKITPAEPRKCVIETLSLVRQNLDRISVTTHPLGFVHLELTPWAQTSPGQRLRMHIWDNVSTETVDNLGLLHDHIWELRSVVLWGKLEDTQYSVDYQPAGANEEILVRYSETIDKHTSGCLANLNPRSMRTVVTGGRYEVSAGIAHSTKVLELPTVTLVMTVPTTQDTARIFAPRGLSSDGLSLRPSLDLGTARMRIDHVIDEVYRESPC